MATSESMPPQLDALVVGAGWAGLQCTLQLAQAGKRVVCLEARKRLGGRAFTHTWDDETPMDNNERQAGASTSGARQYSVDFGCSYIHGYNEGNPVKQIAERYGVRAHIPKSTGVKIIGPDGELNPELSKRLQQNLSSAQDKVKSLGKERRAAQSSSSLGKESLASSMLASGSPLYDGLQSDSERQMATGLARSMHVPLGTSLENVAIDYFGSERSFAGTDAMPEGGFSTLIGKLADDVRKAGGDVRLGEVVNRIASEQTQSGIQVAAKQEGAEEETTYNAKTTIVTMPLAVLKGKTDIFTPSLDAERLDAIKRTNVGNLNKVLLTYKQPWWDESIGTFHVLPTKEPSDAPPSSLEDLYASSSLIAASMCAPNGLPPSLTSPSLLVMVGGQQAKHLEKYNRLEAARVLHEYLQPRIAPGTNIDASTLTHAFYSRWAKQPFTGGATTTPVTLGNSLQDFVTLGRPAWDGALYFAGEHCQPDHRGSIAGAVVSADETARAVLQHLGQQSSRS